ncbi:MAG TPA: hypothetical protein VIJ25_10105 [Methylococcales bacterium]
MSRNNCPLAQVGQESLQVDEVTMEFVDPSFDGTYYQPCSSEEYATRHQAIQSKIESGQISEITIGEYQRWAELDWFTPHGTYDTSLRLGKKLYEESYEEFGLEVQELSSRSETLDSTEDLTSTQLENGDSLWALAALASNSGVDLEAAVAAKFNMPTPVTLGTLNELVTSSPFWVPLWIDMDVMYVGSPEVDRGALEPWPLLKIYACHLHEMGQRLNWDGAKPAESSDVRKVRAADDHADMLLLLAYYAHQWSRTTIADVAVANYTKITNRVQTGEVDKALRQKIDVSETLD